MDDLLKLIDDSLPTDAAKAAQIRHQNERDEATIKVLEDQLVTGKYDIVPMGDHATRHDVINAIADYRKMIERRNAK